MSVEEKIVVELFSKGFLAFANRVKKVRDVLSNIDVKQLKLDRLSENFKRIQESMKPLEKQVSKSLEGFVQPSLTAEQSVQGILDKQKEMALQSKNMKKNLKESGLKRLGQEHEGFLKVMGMSKDNWAEFNKEGGRFNTLGARVGNNVRKLTHGMKGFRMEMLGVMFFGMMMTNFFKGLLRPSLEAVGMFELLSTTLQVLFLPIALLLLDVFLPFLMFLINMSDETKLMIGKMVLLGIALGGMLFIFGSVALGIGSVILAFSGLANLIDKFIPDLNVLGFNVSSVIEAFLLISVVKVAWQTFSGVANTLLEKIMELDFVRDLFEKLGIEIDDNKTPLENLKGAFSGFFTFIDEKFNLSTKLKDAGIDIDEIKLNVDSWLTTFKELIDKLGLTSFTESITEISTTIYEILPSIDSLAESLEVVADTITDVKNAWKQFTDLVDIDKLLKVLGYAGIGFGLGLGATGGNPIGGVVGGIGGALVGSGKVQNDFISRPGQAPVSFSPNDTIVGTKGGLPGSSPTINQTLNINVSNAEEIERMIDENNARLVDDLRRMSPTG